MKNGHIRRVDITGLTGPAAALVAEHAPPAKASLELILAPWDHLYRCQTGDTTCPCGYPGQSVEIKNPKGAAWGASLRRALDHAVRREPKGRPCEIDVVIFGANHPSVPLLQSAGPGAAAFVAGGHAIAVSKGDTLVEGVLAVLSLDPTTLAWRAHSAATIKATYGGGGGGSG